jgi:hypothetical protein
MPSNGSYYEVDMWCSPTVISSWNEWRKNANGDKVRMAECTKYIFDGKMTVTGPELPNEPGVEPNVA